MFIFKKLDLSKNKFHNLVAEAFFKIVIANGEVYILSHQDPKLNESGDYISESCDNFPLIEANHEGYDFLTRLNEKYTMYEEHKWGYDRGNNDYIIESISNITHPAIKVAENLLKLVGLIK